MAKSQPENVSEDGTDPGMSEFYLTTVWQFHPNAAKRVIDEVNLNYPTSQIIYDPQFHWFKINCPSGEQRRFIEVFYFIIADVEDDAFDKNHTNLFDEKGNIKLKFENDILVYDNPVNIDWLLTALHDYVFPARLASLPYKEVWNRLEEDQTTIRHVVTQEEFEQLQAETDVMMDFDAAGKLVYLASHRPECIDRAKAKLTVLWEYSKLVASQPEHLLYSEGYVETGERAKDQFSADMRYMANVHPKLPASTLLDPACISNLERAYQKMYEQGATIRLCRWDDSKGCHFSTYGPNIKGRGGPRYPLGNRPPIFLPKDANRDHHANHHLPMRIPHTQAAVKDEKGAQVTQWLEGWPPQSTMSVPDDKTQVSTTDDYHADAPTAYPESTTAERIIDDILSVAGGCGSREGKKEQLMTLASELVKSADKSNSSASRGQSQERLSTAPVGEWETSSRIERPILWSPLASPGGWDTYSSIHGDELLSEGPIAQEALMEDLPIPLKKLRAPLMLRQASSEASKASHLANPVNSKPRPSLPATITWEMAPLVPERVHVPKGPEAPTDLITIGNDENERVFRRYGHPGAETFNTMNQQGKSRRPPLTATSSEEYTRGNKVNLPKTAKPVERGFPSLASLSSTFHTEIKEAVKRLLSTSPYQRGKVSVRVDFGRVILGRMDPSCLAFNNRTTPSHGWKKEDLLKYLNSHALQREKIHFTKILSTYGSDLEQMINTRDLRGNWLWQLTPGRSWVVYSFRSIYINGDKEIPILINCIFGNEGKSYTYEITPFNSGKDGVTPLYIHDILRNWDLRITMRSFESKVLEQGIGSAVRRFLDTVQVSNLDVDDTDLKYTLPNHSSLIVQEVRVLTKWRYLNSTMKSELEITEVEPLSTKLVSQDKKREYLSQTPSKKELKFRASKGVAARWYEAGVISTTMEHLFRENETLRLGEKTSWDLQTLQTYGGEDVLSALYGPALQMLSQMDQIGGNDCNNMPDSPEYEVRRGNEEIFVPGYERTAATTGCRPVAARQVAGRRLTGERVIPGSLPTPSASSAPVSQQNKQPATPQRRGRNSTQSSIGPARAHWEAKMESMKRNDKEFW